MSTFIDREGSSCKDSVNVNVRQCNLLVVLLQKISIAKSFIEIRSYYLAFDMLRVVFRHRCNQILLEVALKEERERQAVSHTSQNQVPPQHGIFVLVISPSRIQKVVPAFNIAHYAAYLFLQNPRAKPFAVKSSARAFRSHKVVHR